MNPDERFSVYQFFPDNTWERVSHLVPIDEAVDMAHHLCHTVGAENGTTRRVIITDSGDVIVFEWTFGKGVTLPKYLAAIAVLERRAAGNDGRRKDGNDQD